ncbi:hypothetical protein C1645_814832, partial [Glomus cerebriforme]
PLHTYLHYHHRLESIRNKLWKNPKLSKWGKWIHYWERDEFQNCDAIHTHGVLWLVKSTEELINLNIIRADVPNPERTKPEDQWVVPYHAPTLLLWQAHCCFMYVTSKFFAHYITKYITKPEPIGAFDLEEHDAYHQSQLNLFI